MRVECSEVLLFNTYIIMKKIFSAVAIVLCAMLAFSCKNANKTQEAEEKTCECKEACTECCQATKDTTLAEAVEAAAEEAAKAAVNEAKDAALEAIKDATK